MSEVARAKVAMRAAMRARMADVRAEERRAWSRAIGEALESCEPWLGARSVLVFLSAPDEADLDPVIERAIERGLRVAAPRMDWGARAMEAVGLGSLAQTEIRRLGIREAPDGPAIDPAGLDIALIPGLAFDPSGGRLGRGAGFYDRFLGRLGPGTVRIGVCFGVQVAADVPREPHDLGVDALVSERGFMLCGRGWRPGAQR